VYSSWSESSIVRSCHSAPCLPAPRSDVTSLPEVETCVGARVSDGPRTAVRFAAEMMRHWPVVNPHSHSRLARCGASVEVIGCGSPSPPLQFEEMCAGILTAPRETKVTTAARADSASSAVSQARVPRFMVAAQTRQSPPLALW
jgi:hypothetical protein